MRPPVKITRLARSEFYDELLAMDRQKKLHTLPPQLPLLKLSKFLAERTVTPPDTPVPECTTCGACCAYLLYVPVRPEDVERLGETVEVTLDDAPEQFVIDRVLPRDKDSGHCSHLAGSIGRDIGCRIYTSRPGVCREFEAGSDRCHEYRRIYGIEPRLNDRELLTAIDLVERIDADDRITEAHIVEESRTFTIEYLEDGTAAPAESVTLKIVVYKDDEEPHEIHRFDPRIESWAENEFLCKTIGAAEELIASRGAKKG